MTPEEFAEFLISTADTVEKMDNLYKMRAQFIILSDYEFEKEYLLPKSEAKYIIILFNKTIEKFNQ